MATKAFKVDTPTLEKLSELVSLKGEGAISNALIKFVDDYYSKDQAKHELFVTTIPNCQVISKKQYRKQLKQELGPGPYTVIKQIKSITNQSEGLYKLENSNEYYPVSWFDLAPEPSVKYVALSGISFAMLVLSNLIQLACIISLALML